MTDISNHTLRAGGCSTHGRPAGEPSSLHIDAGAASDYDLLPYPSMPITHTQPAHLAALATLFGVAAPAADRARVLELGCASGGNIIPLAARFPDARFTGVDLSHRHIDDGCKRIAALALANVTLRQGDLTMLDLAEEQFDYVICHGVFSWVPKLTQDAVFRLCGNVLAPNGVATISYNVLPGWHLRMAIRDLCLHYAGREGTPQRRVVKARAALERIAEASEDSEPYGQLMRMEARRLKKVPASYILGEFLAPNNTPCYVIDFIERAAAHELEYLCEADFFAAMPTNTDPGLQRRLTSFTIPNRLEMEQHIDFLSGRLFRRSILVRRNAATGHNRILNPDKLSALHIASPIYLDVTQSSGEGATFRDGRERPISTKDPMIRQAFERLAKAYPETLTLNELTAYSERGVHSEVVERVRRAILTMVLAGRASISTLPLRVGRADTEHPTAWHLARMEALSGQPWITSLRHAGMPAYPIIKVLLPHLDGVNDRSALRELLADVVQRGAVAVPELPTDQQPLLDEKFTTVVEQYVEQALHYLSRHALLAPDA